MSQVRRWDPLASPLTFSHANLLASAGRSPMMSCGKQALAEQLGPSAGGVSEADLEELLKKVPLSLGGGKQQVSLFDALPAFAVRDLGQIVKESARK